MNDDGNDTLFRVTAGGVVTTIASSPPFSFPAGVTQDAASLSRIPAEAVLLDRVALGGSGVVRTRPY